MKKILIVSIISVSLIYFLNQEKIHQNVLGHKHPEEATIHSGRTDANGGHNDRINGGYHYHHGCPPHQHPNGTCKYNFKSCR